MQMSEVSRKSLQLFVVGDLHLQVFLVVVQALGLLKHPVEFLKALLQELHCLIYWAGFV
jgi:hypothetical protein